MARSASNTVSPRRIVAGIFVFIGLFVACFGIGNWSQTLMVTGAAVMVLSFSVRMFTSLRRTPRQWILGTGQVLEVSDPPPPDSRYGRCALQLVVEAPGIPSDSVVVNDSRVPVAQWPYPGLELPIEVAADGSGNVRILWKQVPARDDGYEEDAPWPGSPASADSPDWYGEPEPPGEPVPAGTVGEPVPTPAGSVGEPLLAPAEPVVDFDLDNPPEGTAAAGSGPVVAPLPPELDPIASPVEPPPQVPKPRPGPRPKPRPRPGAAPPRGPVPEPEPAMAGAAASSAAGAAGQAGRGPVSLVDDLVTTYPSAHPGPAGAINGVGVTVLVADLDRSIAFYRDQLGFYEVDGGEGNTVLASGETRLVLRATRDLGTVTRRSIYLNLEVADIDAVYNELRANGIRFTYAPRPVNRSARLELWAAAFRDPDGHGIALTQWRPAEPG